MPYTADQAREDADAYNAGTTFANRVEKFGDDIENSFRSRLDGIVVSFHTRRIRKQARSYARKGYYNFVYDVKNDLSESVQQGIKDQLEQNYGYTVTIGTTVRPYLSMSAMFTPNFEVSWGAVPPDELGEDVPDQGL